MAAGTYNFTIEQGTTVDKQITWKDPNGNPINLTGFTARMQIRSSVSSPTILHEFTTENGGITLGGATGVIHILASATVTAGWSWPANPSQVLASGVYDLELVSPTGVVTRLIEGTVTLDPEVTR